MSDNFETAFKYANKNYSKHDPRWVMTYLTHPSKKLEDRVYRRRTKVMSATSVVLAFLTFVGLVIEVSWIPNSKQIPFSVAFFMLTVATYVATRTHYHTAASIGLVSLFILIPYIVLTLWHEVNVEALMKLTVIGQMLAVLVMPLYGTVTVIIANFVPMLFVPMLRDDYSYEKIQEVIYFQLTFASLAIGGSLLVLQHDRLELWELDEISEVVAEAKRSLDRNNSLNYQESKATFDAFDKDKDGLMQVSELMEVLKTADVDLKQAQVVDLIAFETDGSTTINFDQFFAIQQKHNNNPKNKKPKNTASTKKPKYLDLWAALKNTKFGITWILALLVHPSSSITKRVNRRRARTLSGLLLASVLTCTVSASILEDDVIIAGCVCAVVLYVLSRGILHQIVSIISVEMLFGMPLIWVGANPDAYSCNQLMWSVNSLILSALLLDPKMSILLTILNSFILLVFPWTQTDTISYSAFLGDICFFILVGFTIIISAFITADDRKQLEDQLTRERVIREGLLLARDQKEQEQKDNKEPNIELKQITPMFLTI